MLAAATEERRQYLSFDISGGEYAVGILQVKEILQYDTVTRVPSVPASIRGVINLRGQVVPVVDLAVKFGLLATPVTHRTCVLIVEVAIDAAPAVMGVLADQVREVLELGAGDVLPPPAFGAGVQVEFITGMARQGAGFALLLDLDRVISAPERAAARALAAEESTATPPIPPPPVEVSAAPPS